MKFLYKNGHGDNLKDTEALMAGAFGPCRLGKYALEQARILRQLGFDLTIRTTVSNNAYADLGLSLEFERLAWRGIVAFDYLEKLVRRTRPYEKVVGSADELFNHDTALVLDLIRKRQGFNEVLKQATAEFKRLLDPDKPRRPLVGINGEIFLRSNRFSNQDLVRVCENAGLEVVVSPMAEWAKYISYRHVEDAIKDRKFRKMLVSYVLMRVQEHDAHTVARHFRGLIDEKEPSTKELLTETSPWLSPKCGSEAVLSIGSGIEWMESPNFAGVISVMPHGCMPGGIVAAMSEKLSTLYRKPWINVTYDGFMENTNLTRINNFAEILRFCSQNPLGMSVATP